MLGGREFIVMKKSLLIAAFGLVSVGSYAQTFEEKPISLIQDGRLSTIPSCFVKDGGNLLVNGYGLGEDKGMYIYDANLTLVKHFPAQEGRVDNLYFIECGVVTDYKYFTYSQTLFNNDDAFEYLVCDKTKIDDHDYPYTYTATYMKVMSDDGKELARINFGNTILFTDCEFAIIHFGDYNKDYLLIEGCYYDDVLNTYGEEFKKLYYIDKEANDKDAIREVEAPEVLKALPSLARKNQCVNIELGSNAGGSLQVTSANGSVVRQLPIKQGQKSVQLNTRGLASGIYVVSTVNGNGKQENCKIVVK